MPDDFGALLADVSAPASTESTTLMNQGAADAADAGAAENEAALGQQAEGQEAAQAKEGEDSPEGKETQEDGQKDGEKPTPASKVRAALKALRDSGGDNAKIARELNDVYGRYQSYSKVFPKVADALEARTTLDAVGGSEGIAKIQGIIASVNETDQALYAGSKSVVESLYKDCVDNNHPEAFAKLAPHFLDTLKAKDMPAYEAALAPRHLQFLDAVNFPGIVNSLGKALQGGNAEQALKIVQEMARFYNEFRDNSAAPKEDPEEASWKKERDDFRTGQQKEFQDAVASSADSENNSAVFAALKPWVKSNAYFKNWTSRMMQNLGVDVKKELYTQLKKDTAYQAQMKALWSAAKPNKDEILRYHKSVIALKAPKVAKEVLDKEYSGYAGKKAAPAAANVKTKQGQGAPQAQSAPVFVSGEPKREEIDWSKDPSGVLYTTDKAYLRKTGKLVTWNKKFAPRA